MQIDLVFKNKVNGTDNLKEFIHEKTEKFDHFGPQHARWTFSFEGEEYKAHLHVTGNHIDYSGEAIHPNLLSAIESCVEKVERQLKKHKEILKSHHR